jgi:hypothetical protein
MILNDAGGSKKSTKKKKVPSYSGGGDKGVLDGTKHKKKSTKKKNKIIHAIENGVKRKVGRTVAKIVKKPAQIKRTVKNVAVKGIGLAIVKSGKHHSSKTKKSKTKKNTSNINTHEDQTNNKSAIDSFNKANKKSTHSSSKTTTKKKTTTSHHTTSSKQDSYNNAAKSHTSTSTTTTKKKPVVTTVKKPVVKKPVVKPTMSSGDRKFYEAYNKSIYDGKADTKQWKHYTDLTTKYGLKAGTTSETALHNLSLAALSGDKNAQNYLKTLSIKGQTGKALWKGVTDDQLNKNQSLRGSYFKDNATSNYTKNWETRDYKRYNGMIDGKQAMSDKQLSYYNDITKKWHLENYNDPYVQQQHQLQKDENSALDAQDVALNQGLSTINNQSYQDMESQKQDMANRGLTDSGIAADAYTKSTMGANQSYMQAYSDAAQSKSDVKTQFDTAISQSKIDQRAYQDSQQAAQAEQEVAQTNALAKIQEQQTAQDKYLTTATGYVYLNGQVMKDSKGNAITSLALQKQQETTRHNTATESLTMQKINNDLALASQKLAYNYAALDLKSQTAQADIANAQAKLELAAKNSDTAEARAQATILNNQLKNVQKQIDGYIKADKKVPNSLKTTLKNIMTKMSTLANMGK